MINAQTQMNLQMGSLSIMQQQNAAMNATIMGVGGSVAEASAGDYGLRYGNGIVSLPVFTHSKSRLSIWLTKRIIGWNESPYSSRSKCSYGFS